MPWIIDAAPTGSCTTQYKNSATRARTNSDCDLVAVIRAEFYPGPPNPAPEVEREGGGRPSACRNGSAPNPDTRTREIHFLGG